MQKFKLYIKSLNRFWSIMLPLSIIISTIITFVITWTSIPLGIEGEWQWLKIKEISIDFSPIFITIIAAAIAIILTINLDLKKQKKHQICTLITILILGFVVDCAILNVGRVGIAENALAFLNRFSTGYIEEAITAKPQELTSNFINRTLNVAEGETPHHRHVHPPGNVWLANFALESSVVPIGAYLMPQTYQQLQNLASENIIMEPVNSNKAINAALNLTLLFLLGLSLSKFLLICLLRYFKVFRLGLSTIFCAFSSGAAILFLGHYDCFYFTISSLAIFFFLLGERENDALKVFIAGFILGIGATFTLAYGIFVLLATTILYKRFRLLLALAGGGFCIIFIYGLFGMNLIEIMLKCWSNHREFHTITGMGWWPWVGINFIDGLIFAGVVPSLAIIYGFKIDKKLFWGALGWMFLIFSGTARGEFGRLLTIYLPVLILAGAYLYGFILKSKLYALSIISIAIAIIQVIVLRTMLQLVIIF